MIERSSQAHVLCAGAIPRPASHLYVALILARSLTTHPDERCHQPSICMSSQHTSCAQGQISGPASHFSAALISLSFSLAYHTTQMNAEPHWYQPSICVFSGGSAFNDLSKELNEFTTKVTHIIPVSDDGGSTAEIIRCASSLWVYPRGSSAASSAHIRIALPESAWPSFMCATKAECAGIRITGRMAFICSSLPHLWCLGRQCSSISPLETREFLPDLSGALPLATFVADASACQTTALQRRRPS